jgi:molybdopterin converting factor small subunit
MDVCIRLPGMLRVLANGQERVQVTGNTTLECLEDLESQFPVVRDWIRDREGELLTYVQFFVNGERVHGDDLSRSLKNGDEIAIIVAMGGG